MPMSTERVAASGACAAGFEVGTVRQMWVAKRRAWTWVKQQDNAANMTRAASPPMQRKPQRDVVSDPVREWLRRRQVKRDAMAGDARKRHGRQRAKAGPQQPAQKSRGFRIALVDLCRSTSNSKREPGAKGHASKDQAPVALVVIDFETGNAEAVDPVLLRPIGVLAGFAKEILIRRAGEAAAILGAMSIVDLDLFTARQVLDAIPYR
jgi:hypothetical protein